MTAGDPQRNVEMLVSRLQHPDPSQLAYQIAEIAGEETYLRHGIEISSGDTVLDVGANVGVAAAFFALVCGAGTVHCFEPVPALVEVLERNLAGLPGCVVHPYGLAAMAGRAPITYYPGAAAMSGLYANPERDRELVREVLTGHYGLSAEQAEEQLGRRYEPQLLSCELRTLSSFLEEAALEHVHLLKIDVERAELDVLNGIGEADWPRIRQLVMELHDEGGRAAAVRAMLERHGFAVTDDQEETMRGTSTRMVYATRTARRTSVRIRRGWLGLRRNRSAARRGELVSRR